MEDTTCYRNFKNIVIKGSPLYQRSIVEQLDKVWATWTGWAVLRGVIDSGKTVTIVPYSAADEKEMGRKNAFARPTSPRAGAPRGVPLYNGGVDDRDTPQDERFGTISFFNGSGGGSDSEMHFSVDSWQTMPTCSKTVTSGCMPPMFAQNRGPDDTLLHELVHSLREMQGKFTQYPTRTKGYDNEDEFFAILVQNIYASEKGITILRRDHTGARAIQRALSTSEGFLGKGQRPLSMEQLENRLLVRKLTSECFTLCANIRTRVRAPFNPISEYLRNPTLYPYDPKLAWAHPREHRTGPGQGGRAGTSVSVRPFAFLMRMPLVTDLVSAV